MFIASNYSAGVRKYLPIYFSDTPEEDVTEEVLPAEETDKPSKAAKRKRPSEKRATRKKKSEQVSEHYPLSDVLNKRQSAMLPFFYHGYIFDLTRSYFELNHMNITDI